METKINIYIAAPAPEQEFAKTICTSLKNRFTDLVVPSWPFREIGYDRRPDQLKQDASKDLRQVKVCDIFILVGRDGSKGGRFAELGAALALNKLIIAVGSKESVFCYHENVVWTHELELLVAVGAAIETIKEARKILVSKEETPFDCDPPPSGFYQPASPAPSAPSAPLASDVDIPPAPPKYDDASF